MIEGLFPRIFWSAFSTSHSPKKSQNTPLCVECGETSRRAPSDIFEESAFAPFSHGWCCCFSMRLWKQERTGTATLIPRTQDGLGIWGCLQPVYRFRSVSILKKLSSRGRSPRLYECEKLWRYYPNNHVGGCWKCHVRIRRKQVEVGEKLEGPWRCINRRCHWDHRANTTMTSEDECHPWSPIINKHVFLNKRFQPIFKERRLCK